MGAIDTKVYRLDSKEPDGDIIREAGETVKEGGLVAFPTETVYGLGGDALNPLAAERIYRAKGRPSDNPLIVHISSLSSLEKLTAKVPVAAKKLAERFWPGPLTMIFKKLPSVPDETTGGLDTVAVRMPDNRIALKLIEASGGFIAAPSANRSGRPSPTSAKRVEEDLYGFVDVILDGGSSDIGLESTIVDMTSEVPVILRPGFISLKDIEETVGKAEYDAAVLEKPEEGVRPKAPGMKYRHYAPKGRLKIIRGEKQAVSSYIKDACRENSANNIKTAVIASQDTFTEYSADLVINVGSRDNEEEIAKALYESLRECDDAEAVEIFSEEFMTPKLGTAIMNRLFKAAGYEIVEA